MLRIYLECSQTAATRHRTGIQRVVRNIVLNHAKASNTVGVEAAPAQLFGNQFYRFAWSPANDSSESRVGKSFTHRFSHAVEAVIPDAWRPRVNAVLARGRKAMRFRKLRRRSRSLWLNRFGRPLHPRPGDVMVFVDISWNDPIWPAIEDWCRRGGRIVFVIYDILPITNSEFFQPRVARKFADWFDKVCRNADLMLAISDTVRNQLRELVKSRDNGRRPGSLQIESFRLGAELDMSQPNAYVRPAVRVACEPASGSPPYLMVGTIEPRKNHLTVLDAFDRLWEHGSTSRLILVGRRGWKCDEIEQRLRAHPRLGRDLYWFPDLSDTELGHCYRHAKAIVFASWGEGFGLPIVEGLQHGLPVIASDIPVHREVAGNFAAYFNPAKPEALVAWIERLETLGELPGISPAREFRPVSWYQGTVELLQRCRDFSHRQQETRGLA